MESEIEISSVWTNERTNQRAIDLNFLFSSLENRDTNKRGDWRRRKNPTEHCQSCVPAESLEVWEEKNLG